MSEAFCTAIVSHGFELDKAYIWSARETEQWYSPPGTLEKKLTRAAISPWIRNICAMPHTAPVRAQVILRGWQVTIAR